MCTKFAQNEKNSPRKKLDDKPYEIIVHTIKLHKDIIKLSILSNW